MAQRDPNSDMKKAFTELSSGIKMPAVGLGTFRLTNHDLIYKTLNYAMKSGYNVSDLSRENRSIMRYDYETFFTRYHVTMKETYTTTKLSPRGSHKTVTKDFKKTLENLGHDYIDLHLIHFRAPPPTLIGTMQTKTWMAVAKLYEESKISKFNETNFVSQHLMKFTEILAIGPTYKQIEWYPNIYQPDVIRYICEHNIYLQSFSSFGGFSERSKILMEEAFVKDIATRYTTSYARVMLVWAVQRGFAVMSETVDTYHKEVTRNFHFNMSDHEMFALDSLRITNKKYRWDPLEID